jgi:hypothetical protein
VNYDLVSYLKNVVSTSSYPGNAMNYCYLAACLENPTDFYTEGGKRQAMLPANRFKIGFSADPFYRAYRLGIKQDWSMGVFWLVAVPNDIVALDFENWMKIELHMSSRFTDEGNEWYSGPTNEAMDVLDKLAHDLGKVGFRPCHGYRWLPKGRQLVSCDPANDNWNATMRFLRTHDAEEFFGT